MTRLTHRAGWIAAAILAPLAAGCMPGAITAPKGYAKVPTDHEYDFKAVSARGNVFAMTIRENPGGADADLEFWTQAIEHHKVDLDGYRLEGRSAIKTGGGMDGTLFELRTGSGLSEYTYLIAVFVTPKKIYTVEAAGPTEQIKPDLPKIRDAIATLRI